MQAQGNEERVLLLLQFDSLSRAQRLARTLPAPDANTHTHVQTLLCTKWPPLSIDTPLKNRVIFLFAGRFVESTNIEFAMARASAVSKPSSVCRVSGSFVDSRSSVEDNLVLGICLLIRVMGLGEEL